MVLILYILQTATASPVRVLGQTPDFMLLLTLAVAFRESETFAGFFGLICGFLADAVTGSTIGLRAVFFMFLAYFLTVALRVWFRPHFLSYVFVSLGALCLSELIDYALFLLMGGEIGFVLALKHTMLPQILISGIWGYIVYYIVYRYNLSLERRGVI